MFQHLGQVEIHCDAPSYAVVRAVREVGLVRPEDVRWLQLSRYQAEPPRWALLDPRTWTLFRRPRHQKDACTCGRRLPYLEKHLFLFASGKQLSYLLGQCRRCRTIFWEEV
jgi:hypothetical protein